MKIVRMKHVIAGTAGHIDHGKTALVRALTGIDTDRLKEEKARGISIDLGFAHLDLAPGVRLGFVDVPGHERFIKNMLAGVHGIDVVLFIIAADESIKPQTREHFDICRLLNIPRGIVVLTKADLVDREILGLARLEAEEFVKGSFLEGAPIVAVSAVTGEGLPELREELLHAAQQVAEKDDSRWFRLPIDRVFTMKGFGTVVTGTLISGSVRVEQDVEAQPGRKVMRVRGVQAHGRQVSSASAGERTALNLSGIDPTDLRRGTMLTEPGRFEPVTQFDCAFELLAGAKPLRHRAPIHFHAGTAEVMAEIRHVGSTSAFRPGTRDYARVKLAEPLLLLPGDRFIVRMFSPVVTIGGGVVIDIAPPRRDSAQRLRTLEEGTIADRVRLLVSESRYGMGLDELVARTGLLKSEIEQVAGDAALVAVTTPNFWLLDRAWFEAKIASMHETLKRFHREKPLLVGMAKQDLRSRELPDSPAFLLDTLLGEARTIAAKGELVHLASHKVALREEETEATRRIEAAFLDAGLAVPSTDEVLARSGVDAGRARTLLQILLRQGTLVRITEGLVFHSTAIEHLRDLLRQRRGERFAVPAFKDWTGVSRKYAIPLLEFLDREHVTRREGDVRVVL
jgi:selenocysteine-specific elongation factor